MGLKIYLNGKLVDRERAVISIFDHGLLYGDGVFEGIRSYDCLVFQLKMHINRLYRSATGIKLEIPLSKEEMTQALIDTLKANKLRDAYIRLVVTRGVGDLGLDPTKCQKPTVFIITDKIALYPREFYEKGLKIVVAKTRRNSNFALPPTIKSLNYLNNILAKIEANEAGVNEALMLNSEGYVCECTGDNIFIVKDNNVITPSIEAGALEGVTRDTVIELALDKGLKVEKKMLKLEDILDADECFLTGTAAEIIPVIAVDDKKIGHGQPGDKTKEMIAAFKEATREKGVKYDL